MRSGSSLRHTITLSVAIIALGGSEYARQDEVEPEFIERLHRGSALANEGYRRCRDYADGWLRYADPTTGLIPRNLDRQRDIWNPQDAAADNYPFLVLTSALTDRARFEGPMLDMLHTEERLTSRLGALPDAWSFTKQDFVSSTPDPGAINFGASEYAKDGLLSVTEWLGPSPWSVRMLGIVDELWARADFETPSGTLITGNDEVNGELLQVLSRLFWMTGEDKYLEWAIRIGNYYLLGEHHPTRDANRLLLRDHGCEVVSGLCELYATVHHARPDHAALYRSPLLEMLDRILEVGRNEHGLFYDEVNPQTDEHVAGIADTFGYTLDGFYTLYMLEDIEAYRRATRLALESLDPHYRNYAWEGESADGYADAIEGALNLYVHEPIPSTARWIDSETRVMWAKQRPDGIIEGWHGDGNFARTTILYCLWKSQGTTIEPWREDVMLGAERRGDDLVVLLTAAGAWTGVLRFDRPRHRDWMRLPADYPRINRFPEWFTVEAGGGYDLEFPGVSPVEVYSGTDLLAGIPLSLTAGETRILIVRPTKQ